MGIKSCQKFPQKIHDIFYDVYYNATEKNKMAKIFFFSYRFSGNSIIQRRKEKLIQMYLLAGKANYFPCLKNKLSHNGKSTDIWSQKFCCRHSKISTQVRDCFYFHFFYLEYIFFLVLQFFFYLSLPPFLLVLSVGPKNTQVNIYS